MNAHVPSWAARAGVLVLVVLSLSIGFQFWQARQESQLAWVTVAAELIAFAGLAVARASWANSKGWAFIAVSLTLLAAGWCGLTMFEKIAADSRARAVAAAQQTLPYLTARDDLTAAADDLRVALAEGRPADLGPLTIAAWETGQAAKVERLERARAQAEERMRDAIPPPAFDWIALARGVGVELIKLLGFAAFGLKLSQPGETSPRQGLRWPGFARRAGLAGATAFAASSAFAAEVPENTGVSAVSQPDPIVQFPETSKKAQAFAMRGRVETRQIAIQLGVARSTVYRWFRDRDLQMKGLAA